MNTGIDYGNGLTNIDHSTGIRYGVIPQNDVLQAWADSSEPNYGEPHCPHCGNEVAEPNREEFDYDVQGEFYCHTCECGCDSDEAFGDEPISWYLDDEEYLAESDSYGDIFVLKSPFYTHAQFCSPCAPGAGYLRNPCVNGPKVYCFGLDWFDEYSPCPYPIYSVSTGECVYTPPEEE